MNVKLNQLPKKPYVKPSMSITFIELEESIAVSSVQPNNNHTAVKEEWNELGDVYQDVEW